jgi:hypothetical protein
MISPAGALLLLAAAPQLGHTCRSVLGLRRADSMEPEGTQMVKRKAKKSVARKMKKRSAARKTARAASRKAKRGHNTDKPTGLEVQAMNRLQTLSERYIAEGLTPADALTRAKEELRNPLSKT